MPGRLVMLVMALVLTGGAVAQAQEKVETKQEKKDQNGVRLKDIARVQGVRSNQLLGYGIVVGLAGTGDSKSKMGEESVRSLLGSLGQRLDAGSLQARNVAAVLVTAEVGAFANRGDRLNATVSSIGDAKSLEGGVLIQTPMQAGDGKIYGVAQGAVTMGGQSSSGSSRSARGRTVGTVMNAVSIEKEIQSTFVFEYKRDKNEKGEKIDPPQTVRKIRVTLNDFDFQTASDARNKLSNVFPAAKPAIENGSITLEVPPDKDVITFIAEVEDVRLVPKYRARIVVNERTGAIVMGGDVRVDPVAVSRGGMDLIVAGNPYPNGIQLATQNKENKNSMQTLSGASVQEIMDALNTMGAGVRDIISILEALRDSGALHAELIVQ
ncbi:MAG: flagellar basal body P-ring protein FlgI [Spirochaetia bacterium]|nr:flagellar basal body P-ring protein FlgI [Spirochaetia bacterium]